MAATDDQTRITGQILHRLYEPFFLSLDKCDLKDLMEQEPAGRVAFDNLLSRLSDAEIIRNFGGGYNYRLTGRGAIYAEELGAAPAELAKSNRRLRDEILLALARVYEEKGRLYSKYSGELREELGVDKNVLTANRIVLHDVGYAEPAENACDRITDAGLSAVAEYRKTKSVADEFEKISALAPQPRGRALQKLIARLLNQQGWEADEGVRTSSEEMDVIVWREREYYLLECKWERDRIQAKVIRELFGKLAKRTGVNGIVMSMSGFAEGAVKDVHDLAGQRMILLFGEESIRKLAYGQETFTELLNIKYRELAMKGKAELT